MPYIIENGQTRFVTKEELDAYNQAAAAGTDTAPAGGDLLNVTPIDPGQVPEQYLIPNTVNTSPGQPLTETYEPYSSLVAVPPGADPEVPTVGENDLVLLNTGQNLGAVDEFGFVQTSTGLNVLPEDIEPVGADDLIFANTGQNLGTPDEFGFVEDPVTGLRILPEDIAAAPPDGYLQEFGADGDRVLNPEQVTVAQADADRAAGFRDQARQQQTIAAQRKQINNGDWRVRLQLAPQSKYLYNAPQPGILQPLTVTNGVIFPYTPTIDTVYKANYSPYDLTHSNYKGYFYNSSNVDALTLKATFTAQDTNDANYLLAVIHFFRSATKMFYGQDAERGAPPPVVFLSGFGEYQFNKHSCLIQSFNYSLPNDVDYIRAGSISNTGTDLTTRRDRQSVATNGIFGSLNRLAAAFLTKGAISNTPAPSTLGTNSPTYVPTKMDITLSLLPVQSRQQVSKQFSVKGFANGNLIRGGFW
jgi:hypothetical protein